MTEKQVWWTMAVAYGTEREERSEAQRYLAGYGICMAINRMPSTELSCNLFRRMRGKVYTDLALEGSGAWFCAPTPANDALRADYCLLNYYMLGGTKCQLIR